MKSFIWNLEQYINIEAWSSIDDKSTTGLTIV